MNSFFIPKFRLEEFRDKIKKFNKICKKNKLNIIEFIETQEVLKKSIIIIKDNDEVKSECDFIKIFIKGNSPKIEGYSINCFIEKVNNEYQIFSFNKKHKINLKNIKCEHCNTNRQRKYYYQIEKEGKALIVGKSCLKDYLGHIKIETIINKLKYIILEFQERKFKSQLANYQLELKDSLTAYLYFNKEITKEDLYNILRNPNQNKELSNKIKSFKIKNQKTINSEYKKIIKYFESKKNNQFEDNIRLELSKQIVPNTKSRKGLIWYAPISFYNQKNKYNKKQKEKLSNFLGNKKDKLELELTFLYSKTTINSFGQKYFHYFLDKNSNILIWSTTKEIQFKKALIQFTIKDHKIYNKIKQTYITRCKIKQIIN